jgi:g-D-glutamyl-meso-diaminopimelate peptidase
VLKPYIIALLLILTIPEHTYANLGEGIVKTDEVYTFDDLKSDIRRIEKLYPENVLVKEIGQSSFKKPIYAVKVGNGDKSIFINAAHHGREWMTTIIVMKMIEDYAKAYKNKDRYEEYSMSILDRVSIWFVPMVNPDGVTIQQNGLFQASIKEQQKLLLMNGGSLDFSRWKANGNGIDLNRQYSAGWDSLYDSAPFPFYQLYKGKRPFSAPEVMALQKFTKEIQPLIAISYHSSGRVLYWYYKTEKKYIERDRAIASHVKSLTGYKLDQPSKTAVGGGYTDWFIHTFHRPAITVEISYEVNETNPPLSVFPEEWKRNRAVGLLIANEALKMSK